MAIVIFDGVECELTEDEHYYILKIPAREKRLKWSNSPFFTHKQGGIV
jgi:hypothetical protein